LSMAMILAGIVFIASGLEAGEKRSVQVNFDGELRSVFADITGEGTMRGYAMDSALPKLDDSRYDYVYALGTTASITSIWSREGKTLGSETVEVKNPTIREEFNKWLMQAQTMPALVELCADYRNGGIKYACGLLARLTPDGDADYFDKVIKPQFDRGEIFAAMCEGKRLDAIIQAAWPNITVEERVRRPLSFRCQCSQERVIGMLKLLGRKQVGEMLVEQGRADITCMFCNSEYGVDGDQLRGLLAELEK